MKHIYIRDGRRFVKIENHEGMWYQKDGAFQKTKDENSIGLCIRSTLEEEVVIELAETKISYKDVILKDKDILPTCDEMLYAQIYYYKKLNFKVRQWERYWIQTVNGNVDTGFGDVAWRSYDSGNSNGGVGCLSVGSTPDYRDYYYGSRLLKKVIRLKR